MSGLYRKPPRAFALGDKRGGARRSSERASAPVEASPSGAPLSLEALLREAAAIGENRCGKGGLLGFFRRIGRTEPKLLALLGRQTLERELKNRNKDLGRSRVMIRIIAKCLAEARPAAAGMGGTVVETGRQPTPRASTHAAQSKILNDALLQAMEDVGANGRGAGGAVGFLSYIAVHHPSTFALLLGDEMIIEHREAIEARKAEAQNGGVPGRTPNDRLPMDTDALREACGWGPGARVSS